MPVTLTRPALPVSLKVCPDGEGGTAWYCYNVDDVIGSGGSAGRSKGERTGNIDDWTPAIRRAMKDLGLDQLGMRLNTPRIEPLNWSQGAGHAPQGVLVTWS